MNRAAIILMICVLGAGLVICQGCRKTEERPRPKAEPATKPATQPAPATKAVGSAGTIGISVLTMANPFFKDIVDAVTDEAADCSPEPLDGFGGPHNDLAGEGAVPRADDHDGSERPAALPSGFSRISQAYVRG